MFIKPASGRKVRDPVSMIHLPDEGREVSDTDSFWNRRLSDGDVVLSTQPVLHDLQIHDSSDYASEEPQS